MSTIGSSINNTLRKTLIDKLVPEVVANFEIDQEAFTAFLQNFLAEQLKTVRQKAPKKLDAQGRRLPGRVSNYLLFGKQERPLIRKEFPELSQKEIMSKISERWNVLPEAEQEEWRKKADAQNLANGISPGVKKVVSAAVDAVRGRGRPRKN